VVSLLLSAVAAVQSPTKSYTFSNPISASFNYTGNSTWSPAVSGFNGVVSTVQGIGPDYAYVHGSYIELTDLPIFGAPNSLSFEFHARFKGDGYFWNIFYFGGLSNDNFISMDTGDFNEDDLQVSFNDQAHGQTYAIHVIGNATNPVVTGGWQHVVITVDATSGIAQLYVDCTLRGSRMAPSVGGSFNLPPSVPRAATNLGRQSSPVDFSVAPVDWDFLNFYDNYVLTQSDVNSLCHPTAVVISPPVDCVPTQWSSWGSCDVNCGSGNQFRNREVRFEASPGGAACTTADSQACNLAACGANDCTVSSWSSWGSCSCSPSCAQSRSRTVTQAMMAGGLPCPTLMESEVCDGGTTGGTGGTGGNGGTSTAFEVFPQFSFFLVIIFVFMS